MTEEGLNPPFRKSSDRWAGDGLATDRHGDKRRRLRIGRPGPLKARAAEFYYC